MAGFIFFLYLLAAGFFVIPPAIGFFLLLLPFTRDLGIQILSGCFASLVGAAVGLAAFPFVWVLFLLITGPNRYRGNPEFIDLGMLGWVAMIVGGYILGFLGGWLFAAPEKEDDESAEPPPLPSEERGLSVGEKLVASIILAPAGVFLLGLVTAFLVEPTGRSHQHAMVVLAEWAGMVVLYLGLLWMIWRRQRSAGAGAAGNGSR